VREPEIVRTTNVATATARAVAVAVMAALVVVGCAENEPETAVTQLPRTVPPTQPAPTIEIAPDLPIGDTIPTTPATPATPTTADGLYELQQLGELVDIAIDTEVVIGRSVEDRPITVVRRGTPGGTKVLVVGVIHGDEDAGAGIVDVLRVADVPAGIELWLVRSMNPDGQFHQVRHNANGVDLNRNFGHNWGPVAQPGNWEYAGPAAASEPETRAMTALGEAVQPDLVLWYHQDLFRISPGSGRDGEIRARYASLTGLPLVEVTGGTYTGTASQWSRTVVGPGGVGFTIELGPELPRDEVIRHAEAVITIATEL
jgi:protein MpaA